MENVIFTVMKTLIIYNIRSNNFVAYTSVPERLTPKFTISRYCLIAGWIQPREFLVSLRNWCPFHYTPRAPFWARGLISQSLLVMYKERCRRNCHRIGVSLGGGICCCVQRRVSSHSNTQIYNPKILDPYWRAGKPSSAKQRSVYCDRNLRFH